MGISLFARSTIRQRPDPVKRASFKPGFIVTDAGGIDSLPLPRLSQRVSDALIAASRTLADRLRPLAFSTASHVYLPLDYAREPHEAYLKRFGGGMKRVVFLGMNPGSCVPFLQN